jgi:pimeloyl-ACP methyl ester carboxylesterase
MDTFTRGPLRFDVDDVGPADGEVVVLLHGFPADRRSWVAVAAHLTGAGYRVLAPEQRGYSPGAQPASRRDYRLELLAGDVLTMVDAAGAGRFHVVGHDWGAAVAWYLAARHPERVSSLTAVSVPHPGAMRDSLLSSTQALHSWYMVAFQVPGAERLLGLRGGAAFRRSLRSSGLGEEAARRYAARSVDGGMRGPLGWYRALPFSARDGIGTVHVPTLMLWGRRDRFLTRKAAEGSSRWVDGPYQFVELDGTHWLPEEAPGDVARPILDLLSSVP